MAHLKGLLLALAALAGCGDPLVDEQYRGVPIWSLRGDVVEHEGGLPPDVANLRVALFWSPGGPQDNDLTHHVEQVATSLPVQLPSPFLMNIFAPPGPEHLVRAPAGAHGIARIAAYADRNRNGRRDADEPFAGLEVPRAVLYAPAPLAAGQAPTSGALAAGFHLLLLPQTCGRALPMTTPGDCGVPLGRQCQGDRECMGGVCIQRNGIPWNGGACAVPEPPMNGCRPAEGRYYPSQTGMGGPVGFYLKRCQADAECARMADPIKGTYRCDPGLLACVPGGQSHVSIGLNAPVIPFCGHS
jgi:hypothetical protein